MKVAEHQVKVKATEQTSEKEDNPDHSVVPEDAFIGMPPEMPIVIDKLAVRDILGVGLKEPEFVCITRAWSL